MCRETAWIRQIGEPKRREIRLDTPPGFCETLAPSIVFKAWRVAVTTRCSTQCRRARRGWLTTLGLLLGTVIAAALVGCASTPSSLQNPFAHFSQQEKPKQPESPKDWMALPRPDPW